MTRRSRDALAPRNFPPELFEIVVALNELLEGNLNSTGTVTLTASSATTTLKDRRIGADSVINFMPTTANASAALNDGSFYISARAATKGQCTLNHTSNSNTDKTLEYTVIG
jgi:hypothetical protein